MPFAIDIFGNSFCVAVAESVERGAIYFVDHEIAGDDALTRIADDLEQLIQRAEPDEIDPDAVRPVVISTWSRPGFKEWLKQRDERDAARRAERNRPGIPYTPGPPDDFPFWREASAGRPSCDPSKLSRSKRPGGPNRPAGSEALTRSDAR